MCLGLSTNFSTKREPSPKVGLSFRVRSSKGFLHLLGEGERALGRVSLLQSCLLFECLFLLFAPRPSTELTEVHLFPLAIIRVFLYLPINRHPIANATIYGHSKLWLFAICKESASPCLPSSPSHQERVRWRLCPHSDRPERGFSLPPSSFTRLGKVRSFGEKSVTRVDGLHVVLQRTSSPSPFPLSPWGQSRRSDR